jgi:signal peptidase II
VAAVLVACVVLDQVTKALAVAYLPLGHRSSYLGDCFRLEHVKNPGAFLSLGAALPEAARTVIFTWGVGLLVLGALVAAFNPRSAGRTAIASALVAAGGAGNLWDRAVSGGWVTDFMNLGIGPLRTGVFNVADVAIMAGVALLVLPGPRDTRPAGDGAGSRQANGGSRP